MSLTPAVRARGLFHQYDAPGGVLRVLDGLDLDVAAGEHVAVVGRSGSGKSTLLSLLGGLERPQGGEVEVLGHDLGALSGDDLARFRSREVGFVFQHFGLLETLTAAENVELACMFGGAGPRDRRARADELLEVVGLADRRRHRPPALSGGERQRVAIARALANRPRLVLADEPTGNLDDDAAALVASVLASLPPQHGTAVIVVTHDHALAAGADRRLVLREGRLLAAAPA